MKLSNKKIVYLQTQARWKRPFNKDHMDVKPSERACAPCPFLHLDLCSSDPLILCRDET